MSVVLDASSLLAFLLDESGADQVGAAVGSMEASMSAVNLAEVSLVLQRQGRTWSEVGAMIDEIPLPVVPVGREIASRATVFETAARRWSLSLADRFCLATAAALGVPVMTADRAWTQLDPAVCGAEVQCIR